MATGLLLGMGAAFMGVGLFLTGRPDCAGVCETAGLTLLYAGGPVSALFGVLFGGVFVAWPLEVTLWVVLGFVSAGVADRRRIPASGAALVVVAAALIYGLVLSQFVEIGL